MKGMKGDAAYTRRTQVHRRAMWGAQTSCLAILLLQASTAPCAAAFAPERVMRRQSAPPTAFAPAFEASPSPQKSSLASTSSESDATSTGNAGTDLLASLAADVNASLERCKQSDLIKNCRVKVAPSPGGHRFGLIATDAIGKNDAALSIPYDDQMMLTPDLAVKTVFKDVLPEGYDGWTGDLGLLAMLVLNELARAGEDAGGGVAKPDRKAEAQSLLTAWVRSLPSPGEMATLHPLLWDEDSQEILQGSSTKKVYRTLDDVDEDATWLSERIWAADRTTYPETAVVNGESRPCFSADGFAWAVSIASSRSNFVDGALRIVPVMDFANHADLGTAEVSGGTMGAFGTTKGAEIKTIRPFKAGEEVLVTYGPKSAAEYLLEHGFVPQQARTTSVSELTFEVDPDDRFYDDKLDILEFETYDLAPMGPTQSFDAVYEVGRDGEPDPAMVQFLRLAKVAGKDAFLLESIFRKEVWDFMSLPVSEANERRVVDAIADACTKALGEMESIEEEVEEGVGQQDGEKRTPAKLCAMVREAERKALTRTAEYLQREKEALDLKEYYQERRLKDLGLDSEWSEDDEDANPDLGFGQTRVPGGGDLDW